MDSQSSGLSRQDLAIRDHERRHAFITLALAAATVVASIALHRLGALQLKTALPSPDRFLLEVGLFVLVFDFYFYALHRLLHTRPLFPVHAVHHVSKRPRLLTALSFHPAESLALLLFAPLAMLACPIHLASVSVGGTILATSIALAHCGTDFFPTWWHRTPALRWIASPGVHDAHHRRFDCNFSATTSIPDRLFGTYRFETADAGPPAR
jgi:sterol desaturase/sphingolipid hydroxylase (fatty acid hydroxylase superfamily)